MEHRVYVKNDNWQLFVAFMRHITQGALRVFSATSRRTMGFRVNRKSSSLTLCACVITTSPQPRSWYPERLGLDSSSQLAQLTGGNVKVVIDQSPVRQVPVIAVHLGATVNHLLELGFLYKNDSSVNINGLYP